MKARHSRERWTVELKRPVRRKNSIRLYGTADDVISGECRASSVGGIDSSWFGHLAWLTYRRRGTGQERSVAVRSSENFYKTAADKTRRGGADGAQRLCF